VPEGAGAADGEGAVAADGWDEGAPDRAPDGAADEWPDEAGQPGVPLISGTPLGAPLGAADGCVWKELGPEEPLPQPV
jgi:hypothetical protein